MRRYSLILLAGAMCMLLPACATRQPPTGEDYYQQGELNYTNKEYSAAIENYQFVVDKYPFSPYAEEAEMKIGLAYYKNKDYAQAIAALDDFQRMHPTSKNLELVSYYIAMSYFDQIGREDQDQTKTEAALARFKAMEQRFPESEFAELAKEKTEICREVLARHQKVVGDYYFKRANFRAAESRLAELMQQYPDTPVAPDALWELGMALEKEGKKYSAAQAFAAMVQHYPNTPYAKRAREELAKLGQPVDNEDDPLKLVLAENGYGETASDSGDNIAVRQRDDTAAVPATTAYGEDGLPILDTAASKPEGETKAVAAADPKGPAHLKTIRLSGTNPPMSVIFDLTGPVKFEKQMENGPGYTTVKVLLKDVTPATNMERHVVFDRSIFKDCDVSSDDKGTTVTVNTVPVTNAEVVPLTEPARLLVTYTAQSSAMGASGNSNF